MRLIDSARDVARTASDGSRLVRLDPTRRTVFVGDIHGDLDAVERVFRLAGRPEDTVVFLGDVVDRGPASATCLELLLEATRRRPERAHLLMGNHEAWAVARFRPADFWSGLSEGEADELGQALLTLPLAAWHPAGVLALHGALPDLGTLDDIRDVALGGPAWRDITWGDYSPHERPVQVVASRPVYGPRDFAERSARLNVRALVRSHQPDAPTYLFGDRCLTLFTSSAYGGRRRVAVLPPGRSVDSALDLELVEI